MRPWNFSAGPATLPEIVLQRAQAELLDWQGKGCSVMEISHRSGAFLALYHGVIGKLREALAIPERYHILLLQGGAAGQFAAVPMNLLGSRLQADYVVTGHWSKRAMEVAQTYGEIHCVTDSTPYQQITGLKDWRCSENPVYFHYCYNETIHGVRFPFSPGLMMPKSCNILVADMSSMILSEPVEIAEHGIIYACAQKNLGISGVTMVIVRDDLLDQAQSRVPPIWHYRLQVERDSMVNTPPTFAIYLLDLMLDWLTAQGGVCAISEINQRKSELLYKTIDDSEGFYRNGVMDLFRSRTNVPFSLADHTLEMRFIAEAHRAGLLHLKGHRALGGIRASLYNALPLAAVESLCVFMQDFRQQYQSRKKIVAEETRVSEKGSEEE